MTFDELYAKVLDVCPTAVFDEDNERQIVIYTGLMVDPEAEAQASSVAGSDADTYTELWKSAPLIEVG